MLNKPIEEDSEELKLRKLSVEIVALIEKEYQGAPEDATKNMIFTLTSTLANVVSIVYNKDSIPERTKDICNVFEQLIQIYSDSEALEKEQVEFK